MSENLPACRETVFVADSDMPNPEDLQTSDGRDILHHVMVAEARQVRCAGFGFCTWNMTIQPGASENKTGYHITVGCEGGRNDCPGRVVDSRELVVESLTKVAVVPLDLNRLRELEST